MERTTTETVDGDFKDFADSVLEGGDRVYFSPRLGLEKAEAIVENERVYEVVIPYSERLNAEFLDSREKIKPVPSMTEYLERHQTGKNVFDAEFLAPPGSYVSEIDEAPHLAKKLVKEWAEQSDQAVKQRGSTFYSNIMWTDDHLKLFSKDGAEIDAGDTIKETMEALNNHFSWVEEVKGEDYSGVIATR